MRQREGEFEAADVSMVVVTFEVRERALGYIKETGTTWPLLLDRERDLYHGYGMDKAGFWDLWGPSTWLAYTRELLAGRRPRSSDGDVSQRGGDVLIDPRGIVRLHHVGEGPADRPPVDTLLGVVRESR